MVDEIENMIRLGEDSTLEFKRVTVLGSRIISPDAKDIADEVSAAANTIGATFLFGVDDRTHQVEGIPLEKLDSAEKWLRDICNDVVKPAVVVIIRKVLVRTMDGIERFILRMDVPRSLFVHEGAHGYFYRIGSSKRKMPPEMLARLFQQRSQTRLVCFDEQVVSTATVSDLRRDLFSCFRTELSSRDDSEFLRKLHFTAPDECGIVRPTVAGVLFATEHPEACLPSAYIQAVCYRGTERNADYQLDARDIVGPLDVQIAEACHFVRRNMRVAAIKNPARIDIPQYAMSAVFEAVVNAVAHRDYSISGAKIRLHMFSDRLEIFSPGGLPNSLTLDEMAERQFARNELICTCLSRCPLPEGLLEVGRSHIMDRRGEGVPVILSQTERLSGLRPRYHLFGDSELLLTIDSIPVDNRAALRDLAANGAWKINGEKRGTNGSKRDVNDTKSEVKVADEAEKVADGKRKVADGKHKVADGAKKVADEFAGWLQEMKLVKPTLENVKCLFRAFGLETGFSRSQIAVTLSLADSGAGKLLDQMKKRGLVVPVPEQGRGKYRLNYDIAKQSHRVIGDRCSAIMSQTIGLCSACDLA